MNVVLGRIRARSMGQIPPAPPGTPPETIRSTTTPQTEESSRHRAWARYFIMKAQEAEANANELARTKDKYATTRDQQEQWQDAIDAARADGQFYRGMALSYNSAAQLLEEKERQRRAQARTIEVPPRFTIEPPRQSSGAAAGKCDVKLSDQCYAIVPVPWTTSDEEFKRMDRLLNQRPPEWAVGASAEPTIDEQIAALQRQIDVLIPVTEDESLGETRTNAIDVVQRLQAQIASLSRWRAGYRFGARPPGAYQPSPVSPFPRLNIEIGPYYPYYPYGAPETGPRPVPVQIPIRPASFAPPAPVGPGPVERGGPHGIPNLTEEEIRRLAEDIQRREQQQKAVELEEYRKLLEKYPGRPHPIPVSPTQSSVPVVPQWTPSDMCDQAMTIPSQFYRVHNPR